MDLTPEITKLIAEWQSGSREAENLLFSALYEQIHRAAVRCRRTEIGLSMSATDLVHEVYVRLRNSSKLEIVNRNHFIALTTRVMKHYLIDRAKTFQSQRRGGGAARVEMSDSIILREEDATEILLVSNALEILRTENPRRAQVVDLRYFGGNTNEEIGTLLGISSRQVGRDWEKARMRLSELIDGQR